MIRKLANIESFDRASTATISRLYRRTDYAIRDYDKLIASNEIFPTEVVRKKFRWRNESSYAFDRRLHHPAAEPAYSRPLYADLFSGIEQGTTNAGDPIIVKRLNNRYSRACGTN